MGTVAGAVFVLYKINIDNLMGYFHLCYVGFETIQPGLLKWNIWEIFQGTLQLLTEYASFLKGPWQNAFVGCCVTSLFWQLRRHKQLRLDERLILVTNLILIGFYGLISASTDERYHLYFYPWLI